MEFTLTGRLEAALRQNEPLWEILERFDEVALPDGWLVAGAVAQTIWNLACGKPAAFGIKDVDLVYFDERDLSLAVETGHERRLRALRCLEWVVLCSYLQLKRCHDGQKQVLIYQDDQPVRRVADCR